MSLPQFSVRRPVFTTMVTLIIVLLGAFSLTRLKIDLLPNIELPTLTIRTQYEGASPEVVERLVTQIIEEIIATVPGVEDMTSQSSEGNSTVRVTFGWGTDIGTAALDVQAQTPRTRSVIAGASGIDLAVCLEWRKSTYGAVLIVKCAWRLTLSASKRSGSP